LSKGRRLGWYEHDVALQHQLHSLRDAAVHGEAAFLLVLDRGTVHPGEPERVYAIPILNHFDELLRDGVQLFEMQGGRGRGTLRERFSLLPSITRTDAVGWDWLKLVPDCLPVR
jgi:hypothetical protein